MYGRRPYILLLIEVKNLKNTGKTAFCAMMAALASAVMLVSFFPYLTYAVPAIAGLFIMVAVIETNIKWALVTYVVSAVIAFLMAEPEAKMLYILFFGYYPILKSIFERPKSRIFEFILKFAVFNAAVILTYLVLAPIMGFSVEDFGEFGKYSAVVLLVGANIVFPIYDMAVSQMAQFYMVRVHPSVKRIFK